MSVAAVQKKDRLTQILDLLLSGDELGVYDIIVKFRVHVSTVYRDMAELEKFEGVQRRSEPTPGSRGEETVWYLPEALNG